MVLGGKGSSFNTGVHTIGVPGPTIWPLPLVAARPKWKHSISTASSYEAGWLCSFLAMEIAKGEYLLMIFLRAFTPSAWSISFVFSDETKNLMATIACYVGPKMCWDTCPLMGKQIFLFSGRDVCHGTGEKLVCLGFFFYLIQTHLLIPRNQRAWNSKWKGLRHHKGWLPHETRSIFDVFAWVDMRAKHSLRFLSQT